MTLRELQAQWRSSEPHSPGEEVLFDAVTELMCSMPCQRSQESLWRRFLGWLVCTRIAIKRWRAERWGRRFTR
jgi:hypothetical protein